MQINIIPFSFENTEVLEELCLIDLEEFGEENSWKMNNFLKQIKNKEELSFIAVVEKQVVGYLIASMYAWDNKDIAHVNRIAVKKEFSGMQIGKHLLFQLEQKARKIKASKITLETDTVSGVSGFYTKCRYFQVKQKGLINEYLNCKNKVDKLNKYLTFKQLIYCKQIVSVR